MMLSKPKLTREELSTSMGEILPDLSG
jgi:hypothetical protein